MAEELTLSANGLRFHALAEGPEDGPLVVLLHGFPELAVSWRHQLPALAAAGYRAVAPDLRGYGKTEKTGPFDVRTLAHDVAEIIRALGRERAIVVGHDWGGAIAWAVASREAAVVERLVVLNGPPAGVLSEQIAKNPRQLLKSWYIFAFQIPFLPEFLVSRDRAAFVARGLRGGSHVKDAWTPEALQPYRDAFSDIATARAAIGYYRASMRHAVENRRDARSHRITAKTLILWGARDRFLERAIVSLDNLKPYFAPANVPEIQFLENAGHFVQNEAPDEVNARLLAWLGPAR